MGKKAPPQVSLGQHTTGIPESPEKAVLDRVPNPHDDTNYVARFTAPEFTSLCPVTGQPDFAHLVIDYVPGEWLVESKSLKLYLASFRNHGAFHEDCTVAIGKRLVKLLESEVLPHRRILVSARRHSHRRVLAGRQPAQGRVAAGSGRRALSRARVMRLVRPRSDLLANGPLEITATGPARVASIERAVAEWGQTEV